MVYGESIIETMSAISVFIALLGPGDLEFEYSELLTVISRLLDLGVFYFRTDWPPEVLSYT